MMNTTLTNVTGLLASPTSNHTHNFQFCLLKSMKKRVFEEAKEAGMAKTGNQTD